MKAIVESLVTSWWLLPALGASILLLEVFIFTTLYRLSALEDLPYIHHSDDGKTVFLRFGKLTLTVDAKILSDERHQCKECGKRSPGDPCAK